MSSEAERALAAAETELLREDLTERVEALEATVRELAGAGSRDGDTIVRLRARVRALMHLLSTTKVVVEQAGLVHLRVPFLQLDAVGVPIRSTLDPNLPIYVGRELASFEGFTGEEIHDMWRGMMDDAEAAIVKLAPPGSFVPVEGGREAERCTCGHRRADHSDIDFSGMGTACLENPCPCKEFREAWAANEAAKRRTRGGGFVSSFLEDEREWVRDKLEAQEAEADLLRVAIAVSKTVPGTTALGAAVARYMRALEGVNENAKRRLRELNREGGS